MKLLMASLLLCFCTVYARATCNGKAGIGSLGSNLCFKTSIQFTNTSDSGFTSITWIWGDGSANTSDTSQHVYHTYPAAGTYTVKLIWDDGNCKDTAVASVTINGVNVSAGVNLYICKNTGSQAMTGGSPSGGTYLLNGSSITSFNPATAGVGVHTIRYAYTGSNGCKDTATKTITVYDAPVANFSFTPDSACSLTNVSFSNTSSGGASYLWSFGDGSTSVNPNPTHAFDKAGGGIASFSVKLVVTNSNGCKDSITKTIHVKEHPDPELEDSAYADFTWCKYTNVSPDFDLTVTNISNTKSYDSIYTINWGDTNVVSTYYNGFVSARHTYSKAGQFNLKITVTGKNGCSFSKTYQAFNGSNPALSVGQPGNSSGCAPLTLTFPITGVSSNTPSTLYSFSFDDGSDTEIYVHPPPDSLTHTFKKTSCGKMGNTYNLYASALNPCGKTVVSVSSIYVSEPSDASFIPVPDDTGCVNSTVYRFRNTSDNGKNIRFKAGSYVCDTLNNYVWKIEPPAGHTYTNGTDSLSREPYVKFTKTGTYDITLYTRHKIQPVCGADSFKRTIEVIDFPVADFSSTVSDTTNCSPLQVSYTNKSQGLYLRHKWKVTPASGWSFNTGYSDTSASPQLTFSDTGVYIVKLIETNHCASDSLSDTIVVKGKPYVICRPDIEYCDPLTINFATDVDHKPTYIASRGTITSYNWSVSGASGATFMNGTSAASAYPEIKFPNRGTYTISVTATNECGVSSASTQKITILPDLMVSAGTDEFICYGENTQIGGTPSATGGTGSFSYSWTSNPAGFTDSVSNPSVSPLLTTRYFLQVTDAKGCTDTSSVLVTVNPELHAVVGNDTLICYGSSVYLGTTTAATGGTAGYSYAWWPSGGLNDSTLANPLATPLASTRYHLLVTDSKGCTDTASQFVEVNPDLTAMAGTDRLICYGDSAILGDTVVATGGVSPYTYTWSDGGSFSSNVAKPVVAPVATTRFYLTVTDSLGCTDTTSVLITVNPQLSADAGIDSIICNGGSLQIGGSPSASGGTAPYTYSWTPATGLNATNIANPTATLSQSTRYYLKITDSKGCEQFDSVRIIVNPVLTAEAGKDTIICYGDSIQIGGAATVSGGTAPYTYQWIPATGLSNAGAANPFAKPVNTTKYKVTVTDVYNCTASDSVLVSVNPALSADAGSSSLICYGESIILGGSPAASGGTQPYSYSWRTSGGALISTVTNPEVSPISTTSYILTVTDKTGCTAASNITITVNPELNANAGSTKKICYGASTALGGATVASGGTGPYTYFWSPGASLDDSTAVKPLASPAASTQYRLVVTDSKGCKDTQWVWVNVNPELTANAGTDKEICYGGSTSIGGSPTAAGGTAPYTYLWSPSAGLSSVSVANPIASPSATTEYTITITDKEGCTSTDTVKVTVNPQIIVDAGVNKQICAGQSVQIGGTTSGSGGTGTLSYQWNPASGLSSASVANPDASPSTTTTYKLVVTDSQGCKDSASATVTVNPLPQPGISGDTIVCETFTYTYATTAHSGNSYTWKIQGGNFSGSINSNSVSVSWGNAGNGWLRVIETNANGCIDSFEISVTINSLPAAQAGTDDTLCLGDSVLIGSAAVGSNTYSWNSIPSGFTSSAAQTYVKPASTTRYILLETTPSGCFKRDTVEVVVNSLPGANAGSNRAICIGDSTRLGVSRTSGHSYLWTATGGYNDTAAMPYVRPLTTTTYTLTETIDATGCSKSSTVTVTVNPVPSPSVSGDNVVCAMSTRIYSTSSVAGNSYSWSVTGGTIVSGSSGNTVTVLWGNSSGGKVTVVETTGSSCSDTAELIVQIDPLPAVNAGVDKVICKGDSVQIGGVKTTGHTYKWTSSPAGFTSDSAQVYVTPLSTTVYYLTETINATLCAAVDTVQVTVNPRPLISVSGSNEVCANSTAQYSSSNNGNTYTWRVAGGTITNGTGTKTVEVLWGNTGTGEVKLVETNSYGCSDSAIANITIDPLPLANAGSNTLICYGDSVQLGITPSASGGTGSYTYNWSAPGGFTSTQANPFVSPSVTTTYTLKVTDSKGCEDTDQVTITVNPVVIADAGANRAVCKDQVISLGGSTVAKGGNNNFSYAWKPGTYLSSASDSTPDFTGSTVGVYTYKLIVTDGNGCSDSSEVEITVNPLPSPSINGNVVVCSGDTVTYSTVSVTGNSYKWTVAGGILTSADSLNSVSVRWGSSGTGTISVTETVNATTCSTGVSRNVTIHPLPVAAAGSDVAICVGDSVSIGGAMVAGSSYQWLPSAGLSNDTLPNPNASPGTTTDYVLTETVIATGCKKRDTVKVTVNPRPAPDISGDTGVCAGSTHIYSTTGAAGNSYTWSVTDGAIISGQNTNSITVEWGSASVGKVHLTESTAANCIKEDSLSIQIYPLPAAHAGKDTTICYGTSIQLGATPAATGGSGTYSYYWTAPGGYTSSNATPLVSPVITTTYTLKVIDSKGCEDTDEVIITVNPELSADAGQNRSICKNTTTSLGGPVVAKGGNGSFTYFWKPANYLSSVSDSTPVFTGTAVGTYKYTLIVTDGLNCLDSSEVEVIVNPLPTPAISGDTFVCSGDTVLYSTGSTSGNTYKWTVTGGIFTTVNNSNSVGIIWGSAGTGEVRVTETVGTTNCTTTVAQQININPLPAANTGSDVAICIGDSATIGANAVAGSTYKWSPATGLSSDTLPDPKASPGTTTEYILTETIIATGCEKRDTVKVTVYPRPIPKISGKSSVCAGSIETYSTTGGAGNSYTWIVTGGTIKSGQSSNSITVEWGTTAGKIYLTEVTPLNCPEEDSIAVVINPLPLAITGKDTGICFGDSVNIGGSAVSGNSYSWTSDPSGFTSGSSSPRVSPSVTTTYFLTETVNATGCKKTDTVVITVHPLPKADPGKDTIICFGDSVEIGASAVTGNNYQWTSKPSGFTSSSAKVYVTPLTTTTYYLKETNPVTKCYKEDSVTVTITPLPPTPVPYNNGPLCTGKILQLSTTFVNGATYNWTGPNNFSSTQQNPVISNVNTSHSGTYYLRIKIGNCTSYDSGTLVTVHPLPTVTAGNNEEVCIDKASFSLQSYSPKGGYWSGAGIADTSKDIFDPALAGSGTHKLIYRYTDGNGCTNTATKTIKVNPLPLVSAGTADTFCNQNIPVVLIGYSPSGGVWKGNGVSASGTFTPSVAGKGIHTLTYVYADANGCADSSTKKVVVIDPPVAEAGNNDTLCIDHGTFVLSGFSPSGGVWSGKGVTAAGVFNTNISDTGTFTLTYTYGSGTCEVKDTKIVRVHPLPIVNAGNDADVCIDVDSFDIKGFSPSGGWYIGKGMPDSSKNIFYPTKAGLGLHQIVYWYKNPATRCLNTDTVIIYVRPLPQAGFTSDSLYCINQPMQFANTSVNGTAYNWDFGDGSTSTDTSPLHSYPAKGKYRVSLIATSVYGCKDTISHTVRITETPEPLFTLSADSGCAPLNISFSDQSSGEIKSYHWDFGNGDTSDLANPPSVVYSQSIDQDTTYYITLTVKGFCGSATYTDSVKIKPLPIAGFISSRTEGCSPLTIQFDNTSKGAPESYFWDFGNGRISNKEYPAPQVYYADSADTVYQILYIASNGCGQDTFRGQILVHPKNVFSVFTSDKTEGCAPLTVQFTDRSRGGKFMSWDFGDGNVSTTRHPVHSYNQPGQYKVRQFVNNGCSYDTTESMILVYAQPDIKFSADKYTACSGQLIQFSNQSSNVSQYRWYFGDGDSSVLQSPSHAFTKPGTYKVTLTGQSNAYSCIDSFSVFISILPLPDIEMKADTWLGCQPFMLNLEGPNEPGVFYSWDFGDGNTAIGAKPSHTYKGKGDFTVKLVAQSQDGCSDTAIHKVHVYAAPASIISLSTKEACDGPVTVKCSNKSIDAQAVLWMFGDGTTSTENEPSHTFDSAGIYEIKLIAFNTYGCTDTSSVIFRKYRTPVADFTFDPQEGCWPLEVRFKNTSINGQKYEWDFGDGTTSNEKDPAHVYDQAGTYTVSLKVINGTQCVHSVQKSEIITVHPLPKADFTYMLKKEPYFDRSVIFRNTSFLSSKCLWYFGDGDTSSECDPVHRYQASGGYQVKLVVFSEHGCTDTTTYGVWVGFDHGLFVPNALTPENGEPEVRVFKPSGIGLKNYHLQIFDRWGELLWESRALTEDGQPAEGWDGYYNGKLCQQDVYVWKIEAEFLDGTSWQGKDYNGIKKKMGSVHLIR